MRGLIGTSVRYPACLGYRCPATATFKATTVDKDDFGMVFIWLFVAGASFWVYWVGGINVAWYSLRYGVSPDRVHIDPKPRDCDFMTAPLGSKGCHYDEVVSAFNAAVVDAPRSGRDTRKVDTVLVSWIKVND
jgi:hypothetical protein